VGASPPGNLVSTGHFTRWDFFAFAGTPICSKHKGPTPNGHAFIPGGTRGGARRNQKRRGAGGASGGLGGTGSGDHALAQRGPGPGTRFPGATGGYSVAVGPLVKSASACAGTNPPVSRPTGGREPVFATPKFRPHPHGGPVSFSESGVGGGATEVFPRAPGFAATPTQVLAKPGAPPGLGCKSVPAVILISFSPTRHLRGPRGTGDRHLVAWCLLKKNPTHWGAATGKDVSGATIQGRGYTSTRNRAGWGARNPGKIRVGGAGQTFGHQRPGEPAGEPHTGRNGVEGRQRPGGGWFFWGTIGPANRKTGPRSFAKKSNPVFTGWGVSRRAGPPDSGCRGTGPTFGTGRTKACSGGHWGMRPELVGGTAFRARARASGSDGFDGGSRGCISGGALKRRAVATTKSGFLPKLNGGLSGGRDGDFHLRLSLGGPCARGGGPAGAPGPDRKPRGGGGGRSFGGTDRKMRFLARGTVQGRTPHGLFILSRSHAAGGRGPCTASRKKRRVSFERRRRRRFNSIVAATSRKPITTGGAMGRCAPNQSRLAQAGWRKMWEGRQATL